MHASDMSRALIILDADQTEKHLPYADLVPAVARAARELADGRLRVPERLVTSIDEHASLLCMPAVGQDIGIAKIITVHARNRAHGLPAIQGEVVVFEAATGRRLMLLDGPTVTARRTAAVTLLGIQALAVESPRSALVIGTGVQAWAHIDALNQYFGMRKFWCAGIDVEKSKSFCERLRARYPDIDCAPIAASAIQPTGLDTDIVVALTTSRTPVVPAQLPDKTLAVGVGAFRPDMAELPPELLRRRRIVVDHFEGARHEAGDLLQAGIDWSQVSELSAHLEPGAATRRQACIFKTVGHASWDLAAARVALSATHRTV